MKESLPIQLDEPIESSIWLKRSPPSWIDKFPSTGTVLDLVVLLFLVPLLVWDFAFRGRSTNRRDIFCVLAESELLFFQGTKRSGTVDHLLDRFQRKSLTGLSFEKSHATQVQFEFDNESRIYYFAGIYSDLDEFRTDALSKIQGK